MPSAKEFSIPLSDQDQKEVRLRLIFEDGGRCVLDYTTGTGRFHESFEFKAENDFELGKIGDLRGKPDSWEIRLFNKTDEKSRMTIQLEWYESGNSTALATWIPAEAEEGKVTVLANDNVWLSKDAYYI